MKKGKVDLNSKNTFSDKKEKVVIILVIALIIIVIAGLFLFDVFNLTGKAIYNKGDAGLFAKIGTSSASVQPVPGFISDNPITKKILIIPVNFINNNLSCSQEDIKDIALNVSRLYSEMSYGITTLEINVTPVLTISLPAIVNSSRLVACDYGNNMPFVDNIASFKQWDEAVINSALNQGYNFSHCANIANPGAINLWGYGNGWISCHNSEFTCGQCGGVWEKGYYETLGFVYPSISDFHAGAATHPGGVGAGFLPHFKPRFWVLKCENPFIYAHEIGHTGFAWTHEDGDENDLMSWPQNISNHSSLIYTNMFMRDFDPKFLSYLDEAYTFSANSISAKRQIEFVYNPFPGIYKLEPIENPLNFSINGTHGLIITHSKLFGSPTYITFRKAQGFNSILAGTSYDDAVQIHETIYAGMMYQTTYAWDPTPRSYRITDFDGKKGSVYNNPTFDTHLQVLEVTDDYAIVKFGDAASCNSGGEVRSCSRNNGVCSQIDTSNQKEYCYIAPGETTGYYTGCDYSTSTISYELTDSICDGKDSDCDGSIDEDAVCPIIPSIRANGNQTEINITKKTKLKLEYSLTLADNSMKKYIGDWWILAKFGNDTYYYNGKSKTWMPGEKPSYQKNLTTVPWTIVYNAPLPYTGSYILKFGVDKNRNGIIDPNGFYIKEVKVNII